MVDLRKPTGASIIFDGLLILVGQIITMQESPNHIPEGETPHTISINAHDTVDEMCKPGDRVQLQMHA